MQFVVRRFVVPVQRACLFIAAAVVLASAPDRLAASSGADGTWLSWTAVTQSGHSAVCDAARGRLLVFGGWDGRSYRSDVRTLPLEGEPRWSTLLTTGAGPSPRSNAYMIHDLLRDRLIVFGGTTASASFNDVWALSLDAMPAWTEISLWNPPTGSWSGNSAIFDPIRDRMIVYSGFGDGSGVWALPLSNPDKWVEIAPPDPRPAPRDGASAVYDPVLDRMILFGGMNLQTGQPESSVWELALEGGPRWSLLTPTGGLPPARHAHTAVHDPQAHQMLVFGGVDGANERLADAWALSLWSPPLWARVDAGIPKPGARSSHAAVYDVDESRMLVVGGWDGVGLFNDVWALELEPAPAWSWLTADLPVPPARTGHTAVLDERRGRMIVFGGSVPEGSDNLFALSLVGTRKWAPLPVTGEPAGPREMHTAILDPVGDRMIVYGWPREGAGLDDPLLELRLSDTLSWHAIQAEGPAPPLRFGHVALYDPPRHRMIVFGGLGPDGHVLSDAWSLALSDPPAWTPLSPAGPPPGTRWLASVAYDSQRERMLVFGGEKDFWYTNETWALSLSGPPEWSLLSPAGPLPAAREQASLVYDERRDRLVLHGGSTLFGNRMDDTWELPLSAPPAWIRLQPSGYAPRARSGHTAIRDKRSDRMIVFGGYEQSGVLDDLWSLEWRNVVAVHPPTAQLPPASIEFAAPWPNPARADVRLSFSLARSARVSLVVHDVTGRAVRTLADAAFEAGPHGLAWDRRDGDGRRVAAGIYFASLAMPGARLTRKLVFLP